MRRRVVLLAAVAITAALFGSSAAVAATPSRDITVAPQSAAPSTPTAATSTSGAVPADVSTQANGYVPVTPCRLFDTRRGTTTGSCPHAQALVGVFGTNQARDVPMSSSLGGVVPWGATSVVLNVTAVNATVQTYVTVYPAGVTRPHSSSLNVSGRAAVANLVTVQLGPETLTSTGLHFYNYNGTVDVVADLEGYFMPAAGAGFAPLPPCRVFDTRGRGPLCAGAAQPPAAKLGAGGTRTVKVTGVGGIPDNGTVRAVVVNLTATDATAPTYETVYPAGNPLPLASNLNVSSAAAVANLVTVPVNQSTGAITVYNFGGQANVLGDIAGYYAAGSGASYYPMTPCRAFDTRTGTGDCNPPLTGSGGPLQARVPVQLPIAGLNLIPAGVKAVAFNLTVVNESTPTYLTVYPANVAMPTSSNINVHSPAPLANQVVVQVSQGSPPGIQIHNAYGSIDFIVDLAGYYL